MRSVWILDIGREGKGIRLWIIWIGIVVGTNYNNVACSVPIILSWMKFLCTRMGFELNFVVVHIHFLDLILLLLWKFGELWILTILM